jgi:general secretion pathway protein K
MNGRPAAQRGIALLVALLTVALAAVLIAGLLDRGELALARTRNALRGEQAEAYAQGLEAYAAQVLAKDFADDSSIDTNADIWTVPFPPQELPGGMISASMRDLNGCFNLNNLADTDATIRKKSLDMLQRLLDARGVAREIADAVVNWIGGAAANNGDVTDAYYLAQPVPYRSAQRVFAHVSELRLVRGVTSDIYARLAPYVCALPPGTPINVNTASVPVLQTLGPHITQAQAESLWQNGQARWSGDGIKQQWVNLGVNIDTESLIGTTSSYFLARGDVGLDGVPFTFYSVIERGQGTGIRVIGRSRGSDDALVAPVSAPLSAGSAPDRGGT